MFYDGRQPRSGSFGHQGFWLAFAVKLLVELIVALDLGCLLMLSVSSWPALEPLYAIAMFAIPALVSFVCPRYLWFRAVTRVIYWWLRPNEYRYPGDASSRRPVSYYDLPRRPGWLTGNHFQASYGYKRSVAALAVYAVAATLAVMELVSLWEGWLPALAKAIVTTIFLVIAGIWGEHCVTLLLDSHRYYQELRQSPREEP